jgi:hypothetical protein
VRIELSILALAGLFGCDAIYTDLRPEQPTVDGAIPSNGGAAIDAFGPDGGSSAPDATPIDAGPAGELDAGATALELVGAFQGRGGYDAAGTATLRTSADGLELIFSDDFASAAVPGPVVVVTGRSSIGTALTDADTLVARLDGDSIAGPNTFAVDLDAPPDPAFVFIYCEPFGVETARAALEAR